MTFEQTAKMLSILESVEWTLALVLFVQIATSSIAVLSLRRLVTFEIKLAEASRDAENQEQIEVANNEEGGEGLAHERERSPRQPLPKIRVLPQKRRAEL